MENPQFELVCSYVQKNKQFLKAISSEIKKGLKKTLVVHSLFFSQFFLCMLSYSVHAQATKRN